MNKTALVLFATLTAGLLLVPGAAAHAKAVVVDVPNGARCYVVTDDGQNSLWMETNNFLGPGVETLDGGNSGLQMEPITGNGRDIPADTQISAQQFATNCAGQLA